MPAFTVVGKYLLCVLSLELRAKRHPKIFGVYKTVPAIGEAFHEQLVAYTLQEAPFTFREGVEPLAFWERLLEDPNAAVLAVRVLSSQMLALTDSDNSCRFSVLNYIY